MTDYTQLIERLRIVGGVGDEAAQAIEALQARVLELTENLEQKENGSLGRKFYEEMSYRLQRERDVEAAERDAALAKLKELEAQPSPTALELMTEYSNGKQWAQEHLLSEAAINAAAAVLADGYWQHATPQSKLVYASHAREMIVAALKEGLRATLHQRRQCA